MACVSSELDIFSEPGVNLCYQREYESVYKPQTPIGQSQIIEFNVSTADHYTDLRNLLIQCRFKVVVVGAAGGEEDLNGVVDQVNPVVEGDLEKVGLANAVLHALFQQVDLYVSDTHVSGGFNGYSYVGFINNLLEYGQEAQKTYLSAEGFFLENHEDRQMVTSSVSL